MALGTTNLPTQKRNDIIRRAFRDVRAIKPGEPVDGNLMREGVDSLNAILREEDQNQTGQKRFIQALKWGHLILQAGRSIYTAAEGLASDIHELQQVFYRDQFGDEKEIDYITPKQYGLLNPKVETGDPSCVYLEEAHDPASHRLYVWPQPGTIGTTSVVVGTDTLTYSCILKHTSSSNNRPITGSEYSHYWRQTGTGGSVWAASTSYTNGAVIRYLYKRPLFNFDSVDDDPDVPSGWANFLRWRLAIDLSSAYDVAVQDRQWLERRLEVSQAALFPANEGKTSDFHNRAEYF